MFGIIFYRIRRFDSIRESFLKDGNGVLSKSFPNVGAPSELTGIKPMRLFHSCGYMYEMSMDGPGDLMLLEGEAEVLRVKKKQLRNELGKNVERQKIIWYDNKEVICASEILNLVHSTDDACEASLHYACAYPEHQLMNRFMYPNPILMKARRK